MARPRKAAAERRDQKIIVWVTPQEQAQFLINAARAGLTGPDFLRAVACASTPADRRSSSREIVVPLTATAHSALMARAGQLARSPGEVLLDGALAGVGHRPADDPAARFELVDSLVRIGTSLQGIKSIADRTGFIPDELFLALSRLDRALDPLLPS